MLTILVAGGQPRAAGHSRRAASLIVYMHNKNKKQCQTKQNQGISEYAFGGTRSSNRGRKQTSNSTHDQSALKT